jgi:peptidoglycan/LPS O-acetylase OafA/YrhL
MIKPLTSLRFFFSFAVFLSHIGFIFTENTFLNKVYIKVFQEGYIGVSFFFILSGFVLALNYKTKLITKHISFKEFWIARIARIYPLHLLTLIISIPISLTSVSVLVWLVKLITNGLLLQSFIPIRDIYFSFNAPSWSISAELFFYALFPLIIIGYYKFKNVLFLNLILIIMIPVGIYYLPEKFEHPLFYINPFLRIADFSIGILLYNLYERINIGNTRLTRMATLFEIFSIMLLFLFFGFHKYIPQGYRYSCYYWIPMSAIIFVFAFQAGLFSKLLSHKLLILLGEISFSFYLLHTLFIRCILGVNRKFVIIDNSYLLFTIVFTVALIASYYSYRFIELPASKYIKLKYSGKMSRKQIDHINEVVEHHKQATKL